MRNRRDGDDAWPVRGLCSQLERRYQQGSKSEVPKDVGLELQLKTVCCLQAFGRGHDSRIINKDVERTMFRELLFREIAHRGEGSEVDDHQFCVGARGVG